MKFCKKCLSDKEDNEFTAKAKYCKLCVRKINNEWAVNKGIKLKFIPIVTENGKECGKCHDIVPLSGYSNSPRGRLKKATYCKPCASKYQLSYLSKEERRAKTQRYRNNNREWWRSLHRVNQFNRRRKILANSDGTVTPEFVKLVYNQEICYYCNEKTPKKFRTLEHKQPLEKGGQHAALNITMACLLCNSTKGSKTEQEFKEYKKNNE